VTITTYANQPHGFGLTYDDARLACVDDPGDPRRAAAWSFRIGHEIAASVLVTAPAASADEIAAGTAFSVLLTTDSAASGAHAIGAWDWDAVMLEEASRFLEATGAAYLEAYYAYWRGFPMLQLTACRHVEASAPHNTEELGFLYTPEQTFSSFVVWPPGDAQEWRPIAQDLRDGFFLVPLEREGNRRTGHRLVRRLRVSLTPDDFLVVVG
jgi:hypothetical protein